MAVFRGNPYTEPVTYAVHDGCHPTWGDGHPIDTDGTRLRWTPVYGDRDCDQCGTTLNRKG